MQESCHEATHLQQTVEQCNTANKEMSLSADKALCTGNEGRKAQRKEMQL